MQQTNPHTVISWTGYAYNLRDNDTNMPVYLYITYNMNIL